MRNLPLFLGHPGELETVLAYCLDMLGPVIDQRHVVAMQRKMPAHIAADCASAEHYDTLTHYFLPHLFVTPSSIASELPCQWMRIGRLCKRNSPTAPP